MTNVLNNGLHLYCPYTVNNNANTLYSTHSMFEICYACYSFQHVVKTKYQYSEINAIKH